MKTAFVQVSTVFVLTIIFYNIPFVEFRPITITDYRKSKLKEEKVIPEINPKNRSERRILKQVMKRHTKVKKHLEFSESKRRYGKRDKFMPVLNTPEAIKKIIARWEGIINGSKTTDRK